MCLISFISTFNPGEYWSDLEIVGQPVSEADRKFLGLQKVWGGVKLSVRILT